MNKIARAILCSPPVVFLLSVLLCVPMLLLCYQIGCVESEMEDYEFWGCG